MYTFHCFQDHYTSSFGHSKFLPVFLHQKGLNKFGMPIFGHSKFVPVFLEKIWNGHSKFCASLFGKNLQQPFLAIPNCWKKFVRMAIFGHSKFVPVFLGKIVRKNLEWPFLAICLGKIVGKNLEQPFLAIPNFFLIIFPKKTSTNSEWPKMGIPNLFKHVMVCNGLESNEMCTLLDFYKFFEKKKSEKNIFSKKNL